MRELLIDIQDCQYTSYGEPLVAKNMACVCISRDSERLTTYTKYRAASDLAEIVSSVGDPEKIQKLATGLARQSRLVESDHENQATRELMHLAEFGNEDVAETAKASFAARSRAGRGLDNAVISDGALKAVRNHDIPEVYVPIVRQQAQKLLELGPDSNRQPTRTAGHLPICLDRAKHPAKTETSKYSRTSGGH